MKNPQKINQLLGKILSSKEFSGIKSKNYGKLLEYLVDASQENKYLKETTIAVEVFKKTAFDPTIDSSIRVYIHNLRKKLDTYYRDEGKNDPIQFKIPMGHYYIELLPMEKTKKLKKISINKKIMAVAVFVLLLNNIFWIISTKQDSNLIKEGHPLWKDIFRSSLNTQIFLGNLYLIRYNPGDARSGVLFSFSIKSDKALNFYLSEHPQYMDRMRKIVHPYLIRKAAVWGLAEILPSIKHYCPDTGLKLASYLEWDNFQKDNIIFIGAFSTLRDYEKITRGYYYDPEVGILYVYKTPGDTSSVIEYAPENDPETGFVKDYAVVSKLPGPNNNVIIIFQSARDIGNISTTKFFSRDSFLPALKEQLFKN